MEQQYLSDHQLIARLTWVFQWASFLLGQVFILGVGLIAGLVAVVWVAEIPLNFLLKRWDLWRHFVAYLLVRRKASKDKELQAWLDKVNRIAR